MAKLIEWLTGEVAKPVIGWVGTLPWIAKAGFLLLLILVAAIINNPSGARAWANTAKYRWRALRPEDGYPVPLTKEQRETVNKEIGEITLNLSARVKQLDTLNAWSIGQLLAALPSDVTDSSASTLMTVAAKYSMPDGQGFKEDSSDSYPEIHVTAWVAYGYAKAGKSIDDSQILFLLRQQETRGVFVGWWPAYPSHSGIRDYASTYATARSVLALDELLQHNLVPRDYIRGAKDSIEMGRIWLRDQKIEGRTRWMDYPYIDGERMESVSISGLVLHTLHTLDPEKNAADLSPIDSEWITSLPDEVPSAIYKEVSGIRVELSTDNNRRDTIRHYVLPWEILATVDAYRNADWSDRARALAWFDKLIGKLPELEASTKDAYWISAELLIGLNALNGQE
jgi:hypothetical protein